MNDVYPWSVDTLVQEDIADLEVRKEQCQRQVAGLNQMLDTYTDQRMIDAVKGSLLLWEQRWMNIQTAIREITPKLYRIVAWIPSKGMDVEKYTYAEGLHAMEQEKLMFPDNKYELVMIER